VSVTIFSKYFSPLLPNTYLHQDRINELCFLIETSITDAFDVPLMGDVVWSMYGQRQ
jgi:hypothetical protein